MASFRPIRVLEVYKETKDCVVVAFDVPDDLKDAFRFVQGQHISIKKEFDGEEVRRNYSLCSSPSEGVFKVAVKQIPGGVFSTYANTELKAGDVLEVMPPHGDFYVECDPGRGKNYIAFAAGSGITPILSMIKEHLAQEPNSTFKLFYLNRTVKSIIFKEELEQLKNEYFERFHVFYFLTKEKRDIDFLNGRFTAEKLRVLTKTFIDIDDTADCFLCGPREMIFLIRDELQAAGLPKEKIHYELFFSGDTADGDAHIAEVLSEKIDGTNVVIIDGGKEFHFVMEDDYDNLLDGALAAGADLPYACKGGVCSTCKCKIVEGSVKMKVNYALEESEVKKNYVLSCQSVPITDKVVVDFDV